MIVNREPDDESKIKVTTGAAISVDISRDEVIEWTDLEDKGGSVKDWIPKNPLHNPNLKDGGMRARF
jgi:hypothetical protein